MPILQDPLFYLVAFTVAVTAGILLFGIFSFGRNGDFHRRHANHIMLARNISQLVAVAVVMFYIWMRH